MSDLQAIADRVEIEAPRGEFTDAGMMCHYDRVASLFTPGGALRRRGHTSSRIFPWTVRLARRTCASDARCRGRRSAMRGVNRPAVSWLTITPTASARSCWLAR